jgi:hypothetical protein
MTKLYRQNKVLENRTIYVSWLVGEATSQPWVDQFWLKITLQEPPHRPTYRRTDQALAGDRVNVSVDVILHGVTDIVAVVTGEYLKANKEGQNPTDREFVRFVELMSGDVLDSGNRRAFIAPLQMFPRQWTKVGAVPLSDLQFLKDPRFALPPNDDEIYQAVVDLLSLDQTED